MDIIWLSIYDNKIVFQTVKLSNLVNIELRWDYGILINLELELELVAWALDMFAGRWN